jgi:ribosomal protein S18 acetylase RimI-like enzyme
LEFVITRAQERSAVALGLHTNENNQSAQAFYRRAGFEPHTEAAWKGGREIYWGRRI